MPFGDQLRRLRKDKGFTQDSLAAAAKVGQSSISTWEKNKGYPTWDCVLRLAEVLNVKLDQFRDPGWDEPTPAPEVARPKRKRK